MMRNLIRRVCAAMCATLAFPEDNAGDDPYPDNLRSPLVNVPEMYKEGKHDR